MRSLRLSPKGIIRWYADCCKTPVGNTVSAGLPFVGVIHSVMDDQGARDQNLGPVRFYVQGRFAKGTPPVEPYAAFPPRMMIRAIARMLIARLRGKHQPSPFFDASGKPVATPEVVNRETGD